MPLLMLSPLKSEILSKLCGTETGATIKAMSVFWSRIINLCREIPSNFWINVAMLNPLKSVSCAVLRLDQP